MMQATDLQSSNQLPPVAKQALERAGFKVDLQAMDWQTVVSRRARRRRRTRAAGTSSSPPPSPLDTDNPASNSFASGGCDKAWFGWPCDPEMEKLRAALCARDRSGQAEAARPSPSPTASWTRRIYVVLGQYKAFGAYRKDRVSGWLPGPVPVMWNISKK